MAAGKLRQHHHIPACDMVPLELCVQSHRMGKSSLKEPHFDLVSLVATEHTTARRVRDDGCLRGRPRILTPPLAPIDLCPHDTEFLEHTTPATGQGEGVWECGSVGAWEGVTGGLRCVVVDILFASSDTPARHRP
jgi:hypothetical protein